MISGIKIIAETEGSGAVASKGDLVAFECAAALNSAGSVPPNAVLIYELWLNSVEKRAPASRPARTPGK
jgi:hypothetical protein